MHRVAMTVMACASTAGAVSTRSVLICSAWLMGFVMALPREHFSGRWTGRDRISG